MWDVFAIRTDAAKVEIPFAQGQGRWVSGKRAGPGKQGRGQNKRH